MKLYSEVVGEKQDWVSPSYYIDSDHESIVSRANLVTEGLSSDLERAKMLHEFRKARYASDYSAIAGLAPW